MPACAVLLAGGGEGRGERGVGGGRAGGEGKGSEGGGEREEENQERWREPVLARLEGGRESFSSVSPVTSTTPSPPSPSCPPHEGVGSRSRFRADRDLTAEEEEET